MKKLLLAIASVCASSLLQQQAVYAQGVVPTPEPFFIQPLIAGTNDGSIINRFVNIPTPMTARRHNGQMAFMPLLMSKSATAGINNGPFFDIVIPPFSCSDTFAIFPFQSVTMDIWGTNNGVDVNQGLTFGPYFQLIDYTNPDPIASPFFGMALGQKIADLPPLPGTTAHGSRMAFTPAVFASFGVRPGDLISVEVDTGLGGGTTYIDNVHINGELQAVGKSMFVCPF